MDIPHRYVNVNRLLEQSLLLLTMPVQVNEVAHHFWRWILHGHVEWGVRPALPGQCWQSLDADGCAAYHWQVLSAGRSGCWHMENMSDVPKEMYMAISAMRQPSMACQCVLARV